MIRLCAFSDEYSGDLDKQIEGLLRCNIRLMEIRNVNGKNIADIDREAALEYRKQLDESGIAVWSIGSPIGKVDIAENFDEYLKKVHHVCALANIFGTRRVRMFSFFNAYDKSDLVMDRLRQMVDVASAYDVILCHENEKEIYGDTVDRVLEIRDKVEGLRFVYDPANFIQCKQNCLEALDKLYSFTDYFHIKDVDSTEQLVPSGYGEGRLRELIQRIDRDTVLTIEPHLRVFDGYGSIDNTEMKHRFTYATNEEAFMAAYNALRDLLLECGYVENNEGYTIG